MKHAARWMGCTALALVLALPGCFSSCEKPKPLPGDHQARRVQTPQTPLPVPRVQSPVTPLPKPASQSPTSPLPVPEAAAPAPPPPEFNLERINQIKEGMSYEDITQMVGAPSVILSSHGSGALIYKWAQDGTNMLCKFEDGKLVRKTVLGGKEGEDQKEKTEITSGQYAEIKEGMTLDEVMAILNIEGKMVNGDKLDVTMYRWADDNGSSFITRFENGKLVKKSGLYISKAKQSAPEVESPPQNAPEAPQESSAPAEAPEEPARKMASEPSAQNEEPAAQEETAPEEKSSSRVHVAGSERRARQGEDGERGSYRPKAKLPQFTYSLRRGTYRVHIQNSGGSSVKVGLRSGKVGWNASIPANGTVTANVDPGLYDLYYVYSDAPYSLQHGQPVSVEESTFDEITVTIINESVGE